MKKMILLAAMAAAFSPLPASARSPASERAVAVRYADLDLSRPDDVRTLDRRIALAAARACGAASNVDPAGRNALRRCRRDSADRAAVARNRAIAALAGAETELAARRR